MNEQDWVDFVNGRHVEAQTQPLQGYYKAILVSPIEVVSYDEGVVTIEKKYLLICWQKTESVV